MADACFEMRNARMPNDRLFRCNLKQIEAKVGMTELSGEPSVFCISKRSAFVYSTGISRMCPSSPAGTGCTLSMSCGSNRTPYFKLSSR